MSIHIIAIGNFVLFGLSQKEKNSALYNALEHGDAEAARKLLARGADPNYATYNYGPVIFRAMNLYDAQAALDCVNVLLDHRASLTAKDTYGRTALHYACYRSSANTEVIKALLYAGADATLTDGYGSTPLMTAIAQRGWDAAEMLLDYCGDRDQSIGANVLLSAVSQGAPLRLLTHMSNKLDIDVNGTSRGEGMTALHAAVSAGQGPTVEWLLKRPKIEVDRVNLKWQTPLHLAATAGNTPVAKMLLKAGASPDLRDIEGNVPLVIAARANNQELVEALVAAKANLDQSDRYGVTALAAASGLGSIRMVMTLLSTAETRGRKLDLEPALFAAAEKGHGRVLELLIAAGADVNALDKDGRTPLMKAVQSDQVETLSILIKAGAKPDVADRHGMFAYDHSVSAGKLKAKEYLARYRHETVKTGDTVAVAKPAEDYRYIPVNDHSLEVREGDGLSMTFNFWTQQLIFRDTERPAPVTVQNFADVQRQEAIDEAYAKLKELGGNPPDPRVTPVQKRAPGLK